MRTKTLLAAAVIGGAGAVLPATPASAVCWDVYYRLTGTCNPCYTVGRVVATADQVIYKVTGEDVFGPVICFA